MKCLNPDNCGAKVDVFMLNCMNISALLNALKQQCTLLLNLETPLQSSLEFI